MLDEARRFPDGKVCLFNVASPHAERLLNRTHARNENLRFRKSRGCNLRQETIVFRWISSRLDGTQEAKKTHFSRWKSVSFCIKTLCTELLRPHFCEKTHFSSKKVCLFSFLRSIEATGNSTKPY